MSEQNSRASTGPVLRSIAFDVAPSLITYYGLRALGASEYAALLSATVIAGAKVCYDAIRARRLDPFAGFMMLNFGLSLAVGVATSDARLLLAGNTLVGGVGGLVFLGSCVIGTPLTLVVARRFESADDDEALPGEAAYRRRAHVVLSAMWGVGLIVGTGLHLAVIFSTSVDVANAVTTVLSIVTMTALMLATFAIGQRYRDRWECMHGHPRRSREQRSPTQG